MKKHVYIIAIIVIAAFCPFVSASLPDYTYVNSMRTNITIGENAVGNINFIRAAYIPTNYSMSIINATTLKRYDQLIWNGATSLQVTIPSGTSLVMLPNDVLSLTQVGNYIIALTTNVSNSTTLTVVAEDSANISITSSNTALTLTYPTLLTLSSNDAVAAMKVTASAGLLAGNYPVQFNFTSTYRNYTLDVTFVLAQNTSWQVAEDTVQSTIAAQSNSFQSVGYIKLNSLGNVDTTIASTLSGNGTLFIMTQPNQVLFKGGQTYFNVQLQVPNNQPDGHFETIINLSNGAYSYAKTVVINVRDTTAPTIENLTFSSESMGVDTVAKVVAKDNIAVAYVTIDGNGEITNMTQDQQLFTKHFVFTQRNTNTFVVCAYDSSLNKFCQSYTKQFSQMDLVKTNASLQMPSRKSGGFSSKVFVTLNSTTNQNVTFELKDFFSDLTYNGTPLDKYVVQIEDIDGRVYGLTFVNQTLNLSTRGDVKVIVKGQNNSNYGLVLSIKVPSYAQPVETITLRGKFQDYDSPKAFTKEIAGTNVTCIPTDTGTIEESYQSCTLRLSILDDVENAAIVTTIREQKLQEAKMQFVLDDAQKSVLYRNIGLSILAAFAIVSALYVFYFTRIWPRTRFTK